MLVSGCVHWASGTFKLLFCICCCCIFSINTMTADEFPASAIVPLSWNFSSDGLFSQGDNNTYPMFTLRFIEKSQVEPSYILAVYFWNENENFNVVWSANEDHPVTYNATLQLTSQGDLVLRDGDSYVWSTNTSGLSVESMKLKNDGNLVLLNAKGDPIWESYNHPASPVNTLINVKQGFPIGQRLISSTSVTNSTGNYSVQWEIDGLHAYINFVNPPLEYKFWDYQTYNSTISRSLEYDNQQNYTFSYMFLDGDGHLKWVDWNQNGPSITDFGEELDNTWFYNQNGSSTSYIQGDCSYPTTCGEYGVCANNNECSCPTGGEGSLDYFKPRNQFNISSGCALFIPLICPDKLKHHGFLELHNVTYYNFSPTIVKTDIESCKETCLNDCSCKAVFFHYYDDPSFGNCTLPSEILTLMDVSTARLDHKVITFLKVHYNESTEASLERKIVISVSTSLMFLVFASGALCFCLMRMKNNSKEASSLDILVDTISRFSFESLKLATQDFQTRLGRGGFGSVYEGTLVDGTKVAVKRLDSYRQGTKEFLAEVNTIGSIHHFNLVKLIGFCDEGMNRLLVYEYMCNGSLEKWIFNHGFHQTLTWNIRRRIIEGVAAGLEYLHEHCEKNVIHFDIKPQNILLDKDFNVKISDFGLAKMVDRDESQVMTMVRGTPGYMAPELINGRAISVKVDVYSLGVVILEMVCGRRNFGSSEEDILTNMVKAKADQDQLFDLIDVRVQDMQQHKEEVVNMMKIAIWCLQPHFIRPNMSKVVKIIQDLSNMEALNDLSNLIVVIEATEGEASYKSSYRPADSFLSGPR